MVEHQLLCFGAAIMIRSCRTKIFTLSNVQAGWTLESLFLVGQRVESR